MLKALTIILCAINVTATAEIYQWTDINGKVHYSDTKPNDINPSKITVDKTKETEPKLSRDTGGLNFPLEEKHSSLAAGQGLQSELQPSK